MQRHRAQRTELQRAPGGYSTAAKLFVPSGVPDQARGGETSSPSQVNRLGISPLWGKAGDVSVNDMPDSPPASWLWAASQEHPFQTLGGLFQKANSNAALVAAVLEGEAFLSNLTPENHAHLRTAAADVMAPDEVRDRKETSDALFHLTSKLSFLLF